MKQLTEEQIMENWKRFYELIESTFTGNRKDMLLKIADHFQDRMLLAPASSKEHYHNAHPGGYLEHVLNVYDIAMDLATVWGKYSEHKDYTKDEIALVTLFHDLGKMGDVNEEFYQVQDNEWRRNNMGEIYKINKKLINMNGADRSLYILQHFGVQLTQNEWITIKIHEGMYDEANTYYLKTVFENSVLKSHLPHLVHHADMMATRIEYEQWKHKYQDSLGTQVKSTQKKYPVKKSFVDTLADKPKTSLVEGFYEASKSDEDIIVNFDSLFVDDKKEE